MGLTGRLHTASGSGGVLLVLRGGGGFLLRCLPGSVCLVNGVLGVRGNKAHATSYSSPYLLGDCLGVLRCVGE